MMSKYFFKDLPVTARLTVGDEVKIVITHVDSTAKFSGMETNYNIMSALIESWSQSFGGNSETRTRLNPNDICIGLLCLVYLNGLWQRAAVAKIYPRQELLKLFLIDIGGITYLYSTEFEDKLSGVNSKLCTFAPASAMFNWQPEQPTTECDQLVSCMRDKTELRIKILRSEMTDLEEETGTKGLVYFISIPDLEKEI